MQGNLIKKEKNACLIGQHEYFPFSSLFLCIFFHFVGSSLLWMQPRVQVIMDSFADWAHFENVEKESILTEYIYFCRKGEIGRVVRRDQFNRDDMRREKNRANVQNTDNTRDGMERRSVEEPSNSVSTTEVLQFHLGCFRCNFCQVTLKEKDGKRSCLEN